MTRPTDVLRWNGRRIRLYLYYDWVLDCMDMLARRDLDDLAKLGAALDILTAGNRHVRALAPEQQAALYRAVNNGYIDRSKRRAKPGSPRTMDFRADWPLICAAYQQAYGMDLEALRGRLHWQRFIDLLQGLPADTKLHEVMDIRGRDLPEPTKYNQRERQQLMELKQYWALPPDPNAPENYRDQLQSMWKTLSHWAQS